MTAHRPVAEMQQRHELDQQRFEAYRAWEQRTQSDPRFATTRMMTEDIKTYDQVLPETWQRVDVEELTWAAEVLNAPSSHIDRFRFDGEDIIVKETDGVNPAVTLREVYQNGLNKTRADVAQEPGLAFQLHRDELFMEFYEQIVRMMKGELESDTIHMISACPSPEELPIDPDEAVRLLNSRFYNLEQRKSFDYTARRLPDGRLELSATRLDNSNLSAHAKVLQVSGYENVSFALLTSHEYGRFLSYDDTTDQPIQVVIAERTKIYDDELNAQTGKRHKFGRVDDLPDAHEFFNEHCGDYWAGYKAYNELLARHVAGKPLEQSLQAYLLKCLDGQERAGRSVLTHDKLDRLKVQLRHGSITPEMTMSCRELLIYDHHATLTRLYDQFVKTGSVPQLNYANGSDFMGAYADAASGNGSAAAANGETFAGCETATGTNSLTTAAQVAGEKGMSLEQSLRMQEEEAMHCLRIQLYGFTIRKGVHCPFCERKVDARDTTETIECLSATCGKILNKATGDVTTRERAIPTPAELSKRLSAIAERRVRPQSGKTYQVGNATYRRQLLTVVGGAHIVYIDEAGQYIGGVEAEQLEAAISAQLSAETPKA
jgi:hypothetical protein